MQMLFATVLVNPLHSAFKDAEIALYGIGVYFASGIFALGMVNGGVFRNVSICTPIEARFIGVQFCLLGNIVNDDAGNIVLGCTVNMERTDLTATLNQRNNRPFMCAFRTAFAFRIRSSPCVVSRRRAGLLTEISFVNLDNPTSAAKGIKTTFTHSFSNPMGKEPCGFQGNAKGPVQLVSRYALLRG